MGFLIRTAFWFSLVLLVIPFDVSDGRGDIETVGPFQAFFAAKDAVSDIAGMCERKPDVCETGRSAIQTIGLKAREGARIAMAWIEEDHVRPDQPDQTIMTGSIDHERDGALEAESLGGS